ncbi:uncharacterized protein LOC116091140 isoform X3 [Mastomys coucha]|uniref:uncharacterized protein LOC116091140 isoform X3 n=1 Tax=Mastomys coucha TaxID=35658 RepID=UPI0012628680|nr:uncharacterized protein LOC116091140 isoform X3 [Mastomys coucha]
MATAQASAAGHAATTPRLPATAPPAGPHPAGPTHRCSEQRRSGRASGRCALRRDRLQIKNAKTLPKISQGHRRQAGNEDPACLHPRFQSHLIIKTKERCSMSFVIWLRSVAALKARWVTEWVRKVELRTRRELKATVHLSCPSDMLNHNKLRHTSPWDESTTTQKYSVSQD